MRIPRNESRSFSILCRRQQNFQRSYITNEKDPSLSFVHKEDNFIDFNVQFFLPGFLSTQGPRMAKADVNGDGREDVYVCGARNQPGELFLQLPDGKFKKTFQPNWR